MNKKTRYAIRIVAALFLSIGLIGWLAGFVTGLGFGFTIPDSFELPLGLLEGIAVDSDGSIYCGLQFYSRIQMYNSQGKFIYGKFIDSGGRAFRIRINQKDQLEVATASTDKLYVFKKDGTLIREVSSAGHYFDVFGETGERRYHDKNKNVTYLIKWSPLGSYVAKEDLSGAEKIIIRTPFHKWVFMGPLPAFFFGVVGAVMFAFASKDPLRHLLSRKTRKKSQI